MPPESNQRLADEIHALTKSIGEIKDDVVDMRTMLRGRDDDAKDLGLVGDVKDLKKWHDSWHWLGRSTVNALLAAIFVALVAILLKLGHIHPV